MSSAIDGLAVVTEVIDRALLDERTAHVDAVAVIAIAHMTLDAVKEA